MQKKPATVPDPFPTGPTTPEGAACDLMRALAYSDGKLLREVVVQPTGGWQVMGTYQKFLGYLLQGFGLEKPRRGTKPTDPKGIRKLYEARPLTDPAPKNLVQSALKWHDVKFVDLVLEFNNGSTEPRRILVIATRSTLWFAHPLPRTSPLLSAGLEKESPSKKEWRRL